MDASLQQDLLLAHADALLAGDETYRERYRTLFSTEVESLDPLFDVAEQVHALFRAPPPLRAAFRASLKADLIAQAHQRQARARPRSWQWAALGASAVTVAGLVAVAWRGGHGPRLGAVQK